MIILIATSSFHQAAALLAAPSKSSVSGELRTAAQSSSDSLDIVDLYLDAVRDSISGVVLRTPGIDPAASNDKGASLTRHAFDAEKRKMGDEWCEYCYSMVGTARLDNVRLLMDDVIAHHVTGDFIETGVWRGGSSIMARAVLRARGEQE